MVTDKPVAPSKERPYIVTVRCEGAKHRLYYDGQHLCLLDHDYRREKKLSKFSENPCRCFQVLSAWRNLYKRDLPSLLTDIRLQHERERPAWRGVNTEVDLLAAKASGSSSAHLWMRRSGPMLLSGSTDRPVRSAAMAGAMHEAGIELPHNVEVDCTTMNGRGIGSFSENRATAFVGRGWLARLIKLNLPFCVVEKHFVLAVLTNDDVEHYHARKRLNPEWGRGRWWAALGEHPDTRNLYAIVAKLNERAWSYNRLVRIVKSPSGEPRLAPWEGD